MPRWHKTVWCHPSAPTGADAQGTVCLPWDSSSDITEREDVRGGFANICTVDLVTCMPCARCTGAERAMVDNWAQVERAAEDAAAAERQRRSSA